MFCRLYLLLKPEWKQCYHEYQKIIVLDPITLITTIQLFTNMGMFSYLILQVGQYASAQWLSWTLPALYLEHISYLIIACILYAMVKVHNIPASSTLQWILPRLVWTLPSWIQTPIHLVNLTKGRHTKMIAMLGPYLNFSLAVFACKMGFLM